MGLRGTLGVRSSAASAVEDGVTERPQTELSEAVGGDSLSACPWRPLWEPRCVFSVGPGAV